MKFGITNSAKLITVKTTDYSVNAVDSGSVYTNEGTTGLVNFTLPTAVAGLTFKFIVQDSDGIKITANSGDTIRLGTYVTNAAGNIQLNAIGTIVDVSAINSTEWIASYYSGSLSAAGYGNGYFAGGWTGSYSSVIDKLSSDTTCSSISASINVARSDPCGITRPSGAYFAGGIGSTMQSRIDKILSDLSCSSVAATLSRTVYAARAATISSSSYIFGGVDSTGYSSRIEKMVDDTTCSSIAATLTSSGKWYCQASNISSSAYCCGGAFSSPPNTYGVNVIDKITAGDVKTNVAAVLTISHADGSAGTIASSMYICGGDDPSSNYAKIDKLTSDTTCVTVSATLTSTGYIYSGSAVRNSSVYIAGGVTSGFVRSIDKLVSDSSCASIIATISVSRYQIAGAVANV